MASIKTTNACIFFHIKKLPVCGSGEAAVSTFTFRQLEGINLIKNQTYLRIRTQIKQNKNHLRAVADHLS
jgi:hypothetical protein